MPVAHIPTLTAHDLNGKAVRLPQDLPADRTLLLLGFEREQQDHIDTWTRGMKLQLGDASQLPWLELPVIDKPNAIVRMIINRGMRSGIPNHAVWAHVITLYTDKTAFNTAAGITSTTQPIAMVVDRSGNILERVQGSYSADGAAKLLAALHPNGQPTRP